MQFIMRSLFGLTQIFFWHSTVANAAAFRFGPKNCVSLSHSAKGTCVLSTNCQAADINSFEFAFTCTTAKREVQKHSFGVGGFDPVEAFDTEVQCSKCAPPPEASVMKNFLKEKQVVKVVKKTSSAPVRPHVVAHLHDESKFKVKANDDYDYDYQQSTVNTTQATEDKDDKEAKATEDESLAHLVINETKVVTGPGDCVELYRANQTSSCVIHTNCESQVMNNYEFGLDCIGDQNAQVRHLFGKDSFLPKEWFDTLIKCKQCLAIYNQPSEEVAEIDSRVTNLEESMTELQKEMTALNETLHKSNATTPAPVSTVHKSVEVLKVAQIPPAEEPERHRGHLRHHNHRHDHEREHDPERERDHDKGDEEDEDQEDDEPKREPARRENDEYQDDDEDDRD